ncbi:M48 family metalloprotease [Aureimonas leprariae]|uniref:M48 family metallopeptidase n=1 Tax=Plantimonas leprariae TaxID=2615207 RepID=A0A7V7PS23_9HYPH|nr:M48 family metalloprotease [Aureimonas leprariae]KAB0681822.1 M48 family metallopeptidase [Aureimonas leprariae]
MMLGIQTRWISVLAAAAVALTSLPVQAAVSKRPNLPIVRDAEIEGLIADYTAPIFKAANLRRPAEIVLVNSPEYNAFVSGRRIFVNTGTIVGSEAPNELVGVLAHETGHLAGGHQERLREQIDRAQKVALVAGLLGMGIAAAGAAAGSGDIARAGTGIFAGGGTTAMRGIISYQRSEEVTADRSALVFLQKAGQSPKGLLTSFERLERNNILAGVQPSRYISSHPAPRDRIAFLDAAAHESPYFDKVDDPALQLRHDLARAKIIAYNDGAGAVQRVFRKDPRGLPAMYGDAISTHLNGSPALALEKIDALIAKAPKNPYFHEMRGEILMEAGRGKEAAEAFETAAKLDPKKSGLIEASIGQALVTGGDRSRMKEAVAQIRKGLESDPTNSNAYRFLAMAYGAMGDDAAAELATAEGYWHGGAIKDAKLFAARAQLKLKAGTPQWMQAQDILQAK